MIALLQALLRLFLVALAAVGSWAGVGLELPNSPSVAEREAAAQNLRDHTADVFARIEETGIANTPEVAGASSNENPEPEVITPAKTTPSPEIPTVKKETPAPEVKTPTTPPAEPPKSDPIKVPEPKKEAPKPTWIETKLPPSLYDPVDGAAREASEKKADDVALAKKTTVNLACVRKEGSALRITSGSGVVVSPDGLIMTDAHVAYYFLLGEDGVGCSITHPSFPIFGYPGQVVYISPDWVRQNRQAIGSSHTTATGEEDYAFVAFAPGSAPTSIGKLAYASVSTSEPVAETGDKVTVAGYPGSAATPEGYGSSSRLKVDEVNLEDVDSFSKKTADILQTGITEVAASGSSGGGAFKDGKLIGLTVTIYPLGSGYGINSLSTAWIDRDLRADANVSIADLIGEDPNEAAESFWDAEGADLADIVRAALD